MGQEKRPFGVRISTELHDAIEKQAKREGRSPSNLGEVLLTWAFRQLQIAGNSLALLEVNIESVGTRNLGLTSHTPEGTRQDKKEEVLDDLVQMGADIVHGAARAKKKTHRSKAS